MRRPTYDEPPARPQRSTRPSPPAKLQSSTSRSVRSHPKPDIAARADRTVIDQSADNLFHQIPIEVMHQILRFLEDDQDICSLQLSCRQVWYKLNDGHFWTARFKDEFDSPRIGSFITTNPEFDAQYKKRKSVLRNMPRFVDGNSRREMQCLAVLKDLIMDAHSDRKPGHCATYTSKNIRSHISRFLLDSNLLIDVFARSTTPRRSKNKDALQSGPSPLMRMLQVLLAPSLLDPRPFGPRAGPAIYDFPTSQCMAYSSARQQPIFGGCNGTNVNFTWAMYSLNFWRNHMLCPGEATLYPSYSVLAENERPQYWSSQLKHSSADYIGKHWKGAYAFVNERDLVAMRTRNGNHEHVQDEFNGEESTGDFQDLTLQLTHASSDAWSPLFETVLRSLSPPPSTARTRAQKGSSPPREPSSSRSFRFGGGGSDDEEVFLADGWLNALPAQHGVPGFQRMTMMKYFVDAETGEVDYAALWAYEGVVLPGGKVVLGRWWSPTNLVRGEEYSGPFILWCVDGEEREVVV